MSEASSSTAHWDSLLLQELTVARLGELVYEDRVPPIDGRLPDSISNALLEYLRESGKLKPKVLARLDHTRFTITHANLSSCEVDIESLCVLFKHPLDSICLYRSREGSLGDPRHLLNDALDANCQSARTLRCLNLGGMPHLIPFSFLTMLENVPQLESLLLPESNSITNSILICITERVPNLLHLDISKCPFISDVQCLVHLQKLSVLLLHGVRLDMSSTEMGIVFSELKELQVVDVSDKRSDYHSDSTDERPRVDMAIVIWEAIQDNGCKPFWPKLRSLDFAGNALMGLSVDQATHMARTLIDIHPHLVNLSVLDTPLDRVDLSYPSRPTLNIANEARRENCLHALSLYWRPEREAFTAHALQAVYYLLQSNYEGFSVDQMNECARLIELAMRFHPKNLPIQMAASACLYHLCKLKRIRRLEGRYVRKCIDRCLDAAQLYPTMTQLQKNVWLTICNDHLLQSCPIDFYRTCSVALESMLINRDTSVARMTIAIVSIVAPKVSASESSLLADSRYVAFLVESMKQNLMEMMATARGDNTSHFALKFTLSALWNLTDECAQTCSQIVSHGGVEVAFRVLIECSQNHNIRTKVLGLLNNIAEVAQLQQELIKNVYIEYLYSLLESTPITPPPSDGDVVTDSPPRIDVQYFAAGILANLITSPCNAWKGMRVCRSEINHTMIKVVSSWPKLPYAMVAYRSFSPFVNLLSRCDYSGAQLWSIWAVEHVCIGSQVDVEYLRRLSTEGGVDILRSLVHPQSFATLQVKTIASRILSHC